MSVPCIGGVLAAVLLTSNVRERFRLPLTSGPSSSNMPLPNGSDSDDDSDDDNGGFSEAVRKAWPNLAHPGSGYSPQELENFLLQPGGSVLSRD